MDNIRTFAIFGLLIVSLLLWEAWQKDYVRPQQAIENAAVEEIAADLPDIAAIADTNQQDLPTLPSAENLASLPEIAQDLAAVSANKIHIKTDLMDLYIDTKGGDIRDLALLKYPVESKTPDVPVQFLADTALNFFVTQSGLRSNTSAPTHYDNYVVEQSDYELSDGDDTLLVPLHWQTEDGLRITKTYHLSVIVI